MRVELRDGQWAELRERITHADDKALKKAHIRGEQEAEAKLDWADLLTATFIRDWHVLDIDGQPIPWEGVGSLERAPDDVVDALWEPTFALYKAATVPNEPTPPS
jgi:hypothetical protein